jgi:uncharacterized double-CXXCG motif protein
VNLADHPLEPELRSRRKPVVYDERTFASRCRAIADRFPPGAPLLPCADVGPLDARARGQFGDFVWPVFYQPLIRRTAIDQLIEYGVRMPVVVRVNVSYNDTDDPNLVDLQLEPAARWSTQAVPPETIRVCHGCGLARFAKPATIQVAVDSIPDHVDIFRGAFEFNGIGAAIFASDRFVAAIRHLELSGVTYSAVTVE